MNCVEAACDRATQDGGYILLRRAAKPGRWWPHVLFLGAGGVQHYAPGAPLDHPAQAVWGYDGVTWDRETTDPQVWGDNELVRAVLVFALGVLAWRFKRLWRRK